MWLSFLFVVIMAWMFLLCLGIHYALLAFACEFAGITFDSLLLAKVVLLPSTSILGGCSCSRSSHVLGCNCPKVQSRGYTYVRDILVAQSDPLPS